jgi:hypothetical protein
MNIQKAIDKLDEIKPKRKRTYTKEQMARWSKAKRDRDPDGLREKERNRKRAWRKDNPELARIENLKRRKKYADKIRVHLKTNYYLKTGVIPRQDFCSSCGTTERRLFKHHPNYANHLEIVWLCQPCHKAEHKRMESK